MLNIIQNNPYRFLGIFSNSPIREKVANTNRLNAYLNANRQVTFPLDNICSLGTISRTTEGLGTANGSLNLPKDQLKYALFWFINATDIDNMALQYLQNGNVEKAEELLCKRDNFSSLINRGVLYFVQENDGEAIRNITKVIHEEEYAESFVNAICGNTFTIDEEGLAHLFIDTLLEEMNPIELKSLFLDNGVSGDDDDYLTEKTVGTHIAKINEAIGLISGIDTDDAGAQYEAGVRLMNSTKESLNAIRQILGPDDSQYQMVADNLAKRILQCGINYYKRSDDDYAAHKSMTILKYAQSIAVGKIAKDRCDENVHTLEGIIRKLPPIEVIAHHKSIQIAFSIFDAQPSLIKYSIQLLKDCAPHIVAIKETLGDKHQYYLKISTIVVDKALGNVIASVNRTQGKDFNTLKSTLISAWKAQLYMDRYDMEPIYRDGHYKKCRDSLHDIITNCKGFESSSLSYMYTYGCGWCNNVDVSDLDLRTDDEFYSSCNNLSSFREYIRKYPSGKHRTEANLNIMILQYKSCKTIADFQKFIKDFPNSNLLPRAQAALDNLIHIENDRKARIARQDNAIVACKTIDDVIALFNKEKANSIDISKCSTRAFELASCKGEYQRIVTIFGSSSTGGVKAKAKLDEIRKKGINKIKWILGISIPLLLIIIVFLIWGILGLAILCRIFAVICVIVALGGMGSKDGPGCILAIICGALAFGLFALGNYLQDISHDDKRNNTEYVQSDSRTEKEPDEIEYEKYIENQLPTGSKPYEDYYPSYTGSNYLDFYTSGNDYVIIVRDYYTSNVVNHIYIRANDNGRLYLPDGTYNIYFYGGKGWNPYMENGNVIGGFVSGGQIQKDGPVELYGQYGTYTLYPVQNGNLHLKGASQQEAL